MTGYQEILTDPSYCRQMVTLTYPQIGNTGVTPEDEESDQIWASGLIIRQVPVESAAGGSADRFRIILLATKLSPSPMLILGV